MFVKQPRLLAAGMLMAATALWDLCRKGFRRLTWAEFSRLC